MTALAASLRATWGRVGLNVGVGTQAIPAVVLGGLVGLLAVVTWHTWGDLNSDTGYDVVAGMRIAHGHLPYSDFTYYYGPAGAFLAGLAALVGGSGFAPVVGLGLVVTGATLAATYVLGRIVAGPVAAILATAITAAVAFTPNNYSYVLPHTENATVGTLLTLAFLLASWRFAEGGRSRWLLAAGLVAGMTILTKPEPAIAVLAAGTLWLILRARERHGVARWREFALFFAPVVAVPAAVYGTFLASVSAHALVYDNLYPKSVLRAGGDTLLSARMPLTLSSFVQQGEKLALYALGVAALLGAARLLDRGGRARTATLLGLGTLALTLALAAIVDPEALRYRLQYVWGWIPAGAAIAVFVLLRRQRGKKSWSPHAQLDLLGSVVLAVLAATCYAGFFFHAPRPQMAVYYAPFATIFIARLHLVEFARRHSAFALGVVWLAALAIAGTGLAIKDARAERVVVRGPGGALAEPPAEAAAYKTALTWIASHSRPGDRILVAPMMTGLYVLADRQSPLREISLLPGALPTKASERTAVGRLERAHVPLVVTDSRSFPQYGQTAFGKSFDQLLAAWIKGHYRPAASISVAGEKPRALQLWLRRS
jgi:Dolichyl-phosphate-mannose-protein mannosyltransferase